MVVKDLTTTFATGGGDLTAVNHVSFDLARNETLGIVGESGSGKTVLSRTIMGLQPRVNTTVTGSSIIDGFEVVGASENDKRAIWGTEVAMVFQDPMTSLNPVMRIGKQIDEALRVRLGMSRKDAKARAIELLELVGIPSPSERYNAYPGQLSGGMRQRVVIAIALACSPKLLMADEPTTGLDVTIQAQILNLLGRVEGPTEDVGHPGDPRPRRRRDADLAHRRDVRRSRRRDGHDARGLLPPPHALHARAARELAQGLQHEPHPTRDDPRTAAEPLEPLARLQLRATL